MDKCRFACFYDGKFVSERDLRHVETGEYPLMCVDVHGGRCQVTIRARLLARAAVLVRKKTATAVWLT